jgi:glutathione S-transferase
MIVVHHLNDSRSQRILWLLEELEVPYTIQSYQRDPETRLAPPSLKAVHPLGKSPVISEDGGGPVIAESGAIIEYIIRRHGGGRLRPDPAGPDFDAYLHWMHYAEGSAMTALIVRITVGRLGAGGAPLTPRLDEEVALHLGYINNHLQDRPYILGPAFSAADIQMSFVGELAGARMGLADYPNIGAWVKRFQERPAYRAALERGGAYSFA